MSYATNIRAAATAHYRSGNADTSALDMQAVAGTVADAVEYLEGLQRGAVIEFGTGAPGASLGLPGDTYFDITTSDVYSYETGQGWEYQGSTRGKDGKTPVKGRDYFDGYTPQKGRDYFDGKDGKSAWELYQAAGGLLTLPAWLDSLPGKPGNDGAAGSKIRWESVAPTAGDAGAVGDTWFYSVSATKVQIYECYRSAAAAAADQAGGGQWRLRFTSPDAAAAVVTTTPTTGGSGTANYPAQSASTKGQYLKSTGTAGAEAWDYPNRCTVELEFLQLLTVTKKFFLATQLLRFEKDDSIATLSYQLGTAAAVQVVFPAGSNQYTPANAIAVPAGTVVTYSITYANNASSAYAQIFAAAALPQL